MARKKEKEKETIDKIELTKGKRRKTAKNKKKKTRRNNKKKENG